MYRKNKNKEAQVRFSNYYVTRSFMWGMQRLVIQFGIQGVQVSTKVNVGVNCVLDPSVWIHGVVTQQILHDSVGLHGLRHRIQEAGYVYVLVLWLPRAITLTRRSGVAQECPIFPSLVYPILIAIPGIFLLSQGAAFVRR